MGEARHGAMGGERLAGEWGGRRTIRRGRFFGEAAGAPERGPSTCGALGAGEQKPNCAAAAQHRCDHELRPGALPGGGA
jgi:hypothetical protein